MPLSLASNPNPTAAALPLPHRSPTDSHLPRSSSFACRTPPSRSSKDHPSRCLCSLGDGEQHQHPVISGSFLHDLMDQAGIDTTHAKDARQGFLKVVRRLEQGGASIRNRHTRLLDLARVALEVSAEDDALVSHSAVPLPVDSYLERLSGMAMEFAGHHIPPQDRTPNAVLCCLDNYLYGYKYTKPDEVMSVMKLQELATSTMENLEASASNRSLAFILYLCFWHRLAIWPMPVWLFHQKFQRISSYHIQDARDCYLNLVLTRRAGSPLMLALIYSELINILHSWRVIDFTVNMELPEDDTSLPKPVVKRDVDASAAPNLLTYDKLLVGILSRLKQIYWPWKLLHGSTEGSDFLKAVDAANHGTHVGAGAPTRSLFPAPNNITGSQAASARAANHRLQRGIWTSTSFGDTRRALAASERLLALGKNRTELRDYGILLYHCGLYGPSFSYLNSYRENRELGESSDDESAVELNALENVLFRLSLIMAEEKWSMPAAGSSFESPLNDPW